MTVTELLRRLAPLYPRVFDSDEAAADQMQTYTAALASIRPDTLRQAFDRVMADWSNTFSPPLPKHFRDAAEAITPTKGNAGDLNIADLLPKPNSFDYDRHRERITAELCQVWWIANGQWVEDFKATAWRNVSGRSDWTETTLRAYLDAKFRDMVLTYARAWSLPVYFGRKTHDAFRLSDEQLVYSGLKRFLTRPEASAQP